MSEPAARRPSERRGSRRVSLRRSIRIECRRGSHGLGRDLTDCALDLSETGARLLVREPFRLGEEAEVLLGGSGLARPVKRLARVVWSVTTEGRHMIGLRFDKPVPYGDLQALAAPPRVLR